MILAITLSLILTATLYAVFAGVIYVKLNKGLLVYHSEFGFNVRYYVCRNINVPFQVLGIGKFSRIIVSRYATDYFKKEQLDALILHEQGHKVASFSVSKLLYIIVIILLFYPLAALLTGIWQPLFILALLKAVLIIKAALFTVHQHRNEYAADLFSAQVLKNQSKHPDLIRALMEVPYLRESESHPSINNRIEKIYEGISDRTNKV